LQGYTFAPGGIIRLPSDAWGILETTRESPFFAGSVYGFWILDTQVKFPARLPRFTSLKLILFIKIITAQLSCQQLFLIHGCFSGDIVLEYY
jgi:hypothetical protein